MSHIQIRNPRTATDTITDLDALRLATERCGGKFLRDQHNFNMYGGRHRDAVNGMPVAHALQPATDGHTYGYEVGVIDKGQNQYELAADFMDPAIQRTFGNNFDRLNMFYQMEAAKNLAQKQGLPYTEHQMANGEYVVEVDTTVQLGY